MGPPSLNGGNRAWPGSPRTWPAALQWGRRLSTAETCDTTLRPAGSREASMGPPSLNGGNPSLVPVEYELLIKLQWGRRLSTAETWITVGF